MIHQHQKCWELAHLSTSLDKILNGKKGWLSLTFLEMKFILKISTNTALYFQILEVAIYAPSFLSTAFQ